MDEYLTYEEQPDSFELTCGCQVTKADEGKIYEIVTFCEDCDPSIIRE